MKDPSDSALIQLCAGPPIAPVPDGVPRPFWSVMFPTYNPSNDLELALQSVLAQDPGPERMQIEVIDNDSSNTNPEATARDIGKGRIRFHRQPRNVGIVCNFNACIERAHGRWVHILCHDDMVMPGYDRAMEELARLNPTAAMLCCRSLIVHENGDAQLTPALPGLEKLTNDPRELLYRNHLRMGVVLRRDLFDRIGGFKTNLPFMLDWEMWVRAIRFGGGIMTRLPLIYYRFHAQMQTSAAMRNGDHAGDQIRLAEEIRKMVPEISLCRHRWVASCNAFGQSWRFNHENDPVAASANERTWKEITPWWMRFGVRLRHFMLRGIWTAKWLLKSS